VLIKHIPVAAPFIKKDDVYDCITFTPTHAVGVNIPRGPSPAAVFLDYVADPPWYEFRLTTKIQYLGAPDTTVRLLDGVVHWALSGTSPVLTSFGVSSGPLEWDTWYCIDILYQTYVSTSLSIRIYSDEARETLVEVLNVPVPGSTLPERLLTGLRRSFTVDGTGPASLELKDVYRLYQSHVVSFVTQPRTVLRPWYVFDGENPTSNYFYNQEMTECSETAELTTPIEEWVFAEDVLASPRGRILSEIASWTLPNHAQYLLYTLGRLDVPHKLYLRQPLKWGGSEWIMHAMTIREHAIAPCHIVLHPGYDVLVGFIDTTSDPALSSGPLTVLRLIATRYRLGGTIYTIGDEVDTGFTATDTGGFFLLEDGRIGLIYRDTDCALQVIYSDLTGQTWTA
jgi:hypothetical protein